jgi:hypothetical protein
MAVLNARVDHAAVNVLELDPSSRQPILKKCDRQLLKLRLTDHGGFYQAKVFLLSTLSFGRKFVGTPRFRTHGSISLGHAGASLKRDPGSPGTQEFLHDLALYAHLSPMNLRSAVESLAGLTPAPADDSWTHKWAQCKIGNPGRGSDTTSA